MYTIVSPTGVNFGYVGAVLHNGRTVALTDVYPFEEAAKVAADELAEKIADEEDAQGKAFGFYDGNVGELFDAIEELPTGARIVDEDGRRIVGARFHGTPGADATLTLTFRPAEADNERN